MFTHAPKYLQKHAKLIEVPVKSVSKCEMPKIIDQLPDNELDVATVRPQTGCTNEIVKIHILKKKHKNCLHAPGAIEIGRRTDI